MAKSPPKRLTLTIKNYCFTPSWSMIFITLLLLALFLRLGFWQLSRAEEKEYLQARYLSKSAIPSFSLNTLPHDPADWDDAPLEVTGTYDTVRNILLDNKIYQHRVGYDVLTPMYIAGDKRAVLIDRGWIPALHHRNLLPEIAKVEGTQTIHGTIYVTSQKMLTLKNLPESMGKWPLRIQTLDIPELEKQLGMPLYPFVIRLNEHEPTSFVRNWQPINSPPYKHVGYAVQWFTFGLVLIIIFIALNIHKRR